MGDDAGEPGRVEDALVEIELPGASLARHKATLQPVGEPGDDALQMRQLLVEQVTQPAELVRVAQFVGFDDLVRDGAEGFVDRVLVGAAARHLTGAAGAAGVVVAGAGHHLAVGIGVAVLLGVLGRAVGRRALHRGLRAGGGALAAIGLVLAVRLVALALLVVRRIVHLAEIEVEILDQPARGAGIGILVEDDAIELAEILGDLVLQPWPPQVDDALRRRRRRLVGQRLAGQQPHRFGHRPFGALGDAFETLAAILLVEQRRKIGGDPGHAARAERLDPRLLQRFEDRPRQRPAGQALRMHRIVMVAQPQRHAVRGAAQLRDLLGRQVARRVRQFDPFSREPRRFGAKRDVDLLALGDRAQGCRGRPLEDLGRREFLRHTGLTPSTSRSR